MTRMHAGGLGVLSALSIAFLLGHLGPPGPDGDFSSPDLPNHRPEPLAVGELALDPRSGAGRQNSAESWSNVQGWYASTSQTAVSLPSGITTSPNNSLVFLMAGRGFRRTCPSYGGQSLSFG